MLTLIREKRSPYQKLNLLSQGAKFESLGISKLSAKGRKLPVLKLLFTNFCINRCRYCYNRCQNDIPREIFEPKELADLTVQLYQKGYIKGLFLSSGIFRSPEDTMERMIETVKLLRETYQFKGYIHLKILPYVARELIVKATRYANRVSCNLEFSTQKVLRSWAPDKDKYKLLHTLHLIKSASKETDSKCSISTQVIVGLKDETDRSILKLSTQLYKSRVVNRVYYSAYVPVNEESNFDVNISHLREYRLYQADFLIRSYGFSVEELLQEKENLCFDKDPKLVWAEANPEFFPVDLAKDDYWKLVRVPGIGPKIAQKILKLRKSGLGVSDISALGLDLALIKRYVTINGRTIPQNLCLFQ